MASPTDTDPCRRWERWLRGAGGTPVGRSDRSQIDRRRRSRRSRRFGGHDRRFRMPGARPTVSPTPGQSRTGAGAGSGGASPQIGDTSPEASLRPVWPGLYEIAHALI